MQSNSSSQGALTARHCSRRDDAPRELVSTSREASLNDLPFNLRRTGGAQVALTKCEDFAWEAVSLPGQHGRINDPRQLSAADGQLRDLAQAVLQCIDIRKLATEPVAT